MDYIIQLAILIAIASLIFGISAWKLFTKLGEPAYKAFIPGINYATVAKNCGKPRWWAILAYIPIIGPIMMTVFNVLLIQKFGKKSVVDTILAIILPFIYVAFVNYNAKSTVETKETEFFLPGEKPKKRKESLLGALTFAAVFATCIHTYIIQPFGIPTGSMERTLLVGDFLFVNKWAYGYRLPMRPVALPFFQGTIMDIGKPGNPKDDPKSYIESIKLPYSRIPVGNKISRRDIVVFNYPQDSVHSSFDRADPYVKRCAAVAGDILEFKAGRLFINNKPEEKLGDQEIQHAYTVISQEPLDINGLYDRFGFLSVMDASGNSSYQYIFSGLTPGIANEIKNLPGVASVKEYLDTPGVPALSYKKIADSSGRPEKDDSGNTLYSKNLDVSSSIFPINKPWNPDYYGPIQVPKKGDVVNLTADNFYLYRWIISRYEGHTLEQKDGKFFIDSKPATTYTVQYDYYMMIGDNRDASLDSRFFGFVPETHIMGKPMFTWMSLQGAFPDANSSYQAPFKVRWDRMFKATNTGEVNKTSYWWIAAIVLLLFFFWEQVMKLFKKNTKK